MSVFRNEGDLEGSTVNIESGAAVRGNIQNQGGQINITANTVVSGGNVAITNGALNFQQIGFVHGPELESLNFTSTLAFGGKSDSVEFQGGAAGLMINVNIPLKEIAVFSLGEKIADFHLSHAGPGTYSASDFSVKGDQLLYHHS